MDKRSKSFERGCCRCFEQVLNLFVSILLFRRAFVTKVKEIEEKFYFLITRLNRERYFRKGFYDMETQTGKEGVLGLQDLKKYMQKVNHKIPTSTLKEKFTKYDKNYVNEIGFDDFCSILQEVRYSLFQE